MAINSDGSLSLAPSFNALYTSPSSYFGASPPTPTATFMPPPDHRHGCTRSRPKARRAIIFAPQELQVQALAIDGSGVIYAATSPDGKVYKIVRGGSAPESADGTHTVAEVAAAQEGESKPVRGKPRVAVTQLYRNGFLRTEDEVYLEPRARQAGTPLHRQRRPGRNIPGGYKRQGQFFSRAMKPRFACSTSTRRGT